MYDIAANAADCNPITYPKGSAESNHDVTSE
jgi:hypothetical protein